MKRTGTAVLTVLVLLTVAASSGDVLGMGVRVGRRPFLELLLR